MRCIRLPWFRRREGNKLEETPPSNTSTATTTTIKDEVPHGLEIIYEGDDPIIDIVAIHGLDGHREKTWTAKNNVNWLRDLLPNDLPHARILCWGYDANTTGSRMSCQYLHDHARSLVGDLCMRRTMTRSTHRPIIFIAHSLGGIIVKSALIYSDAARQGALPEHRSIKVSTYGIMFMGTPHQGANGTELKEQLMNIASIFVGTNHRLIQHMEKDSEWLQHQLGQYGPISGDFVTKFAYEEYETPTKLGHKIMVVPRVSAVVPGQAAAEQIVIHADHINMVKFLSKEDTGYVTISGHLQIMVGNAGSLIQSKWETENRVNEARDNNGPKEFSIPLSLTGLTPVTHFVAREADLEQMHKYLETETSDGRRTVILQGMGGMGKTQLSIAYMKCHKDRYAATFWINARDQVLLKQSFLAAAKRILKNSPSFIYIKNALDSNDPDGITSAVLRWLDEPENHQWLLIYDNYDDPKLDGHEVETDQSGLDLEVGLNDGATHQVSKAFDIRVYFPENDHGAVVITTRSASVQLGHFIPLGKLKSQEDGLKILASTSHRHNLEKDDAALELVRRLDGLPLALSTAGAYLHQVSTSISDYLKLYETSWEQLQRASPRLLSYQYTMYSTWDISFEHVKQQNPDSAILLRLWGYFDNEDLWYELLRDGENVGESYGKKEVRLLQGLTETLTKDKIRFDGLMRILCNHGLVESCPSMGEYAGRSPGYSMHDCVHAWIRYVLNKDVDIEMAQLAIRSIATHTPDKDEREYWITQRLLLRHADYCLQFMANDAVFQGRNWEFHCLGGLYSDQGRLSEAEAMYERALQGYEKALGPKTFTHPSTINTLENLGGLFVKRNKSSQARIYFVRAEAGIRIVYGESHERYKEITYRLRGCKTPISCIVRQPRQAHALEDREALTCLILFSLTNHMPGPEEFTHKWPLL